MLASACGYHARVVAWKFIEPGPIPLPLNLPTIPKGAHFCRPPASRLEYRGSGPPYTHQAYPHMFVVRNRGSRTCVIGGRPAIRFRKSAPTPIEIVDGGSTTPDYPSDGRPWGLRPGKTASEHIVTWAVCEGPGDYVRRGAAEVWYRGMRPVRIAFLTCARSGVSIAVGPFEPPPTPDEEAPWQLRARLIGVPHEVHAGSTATYRVRLTNVGAKPFRFPYCPPIDVRVGRSDHSWTLNCKPAGAIAAGASVEFEQRTTVAHGFPPGRYHLRWSLEQVGNERERIIASTIVRVEEP